MINSFISLMMTTMHRRKNVCRIQILMNCYRYQGGIRSPASALRSPLFLEYLPYDLHCR